MRAFVLLQAADVALTRGDYVEAYDLALRSNDQATQNPEVAYIWAARPATLARDPKRLRVAVDGLLAVPLSGPQTGSAKDHVRGSLLALEGQAAEALELIRSAHAASLRLGQRFEAARIALDALVVLPGEPEVQGWAPQARAVFEELRAAPYLAKLDSVLAQAPGTGGAPTSAAPTAAVPR
jgi:hypothetical protein